MVVLNTRLLCPRHEDSNGVVHMPKGYLGERQVKLSKAYHRVEGGSVIPTFSQGWCDSIRRKTKLFSRAGMVGIASVTSRDALRLSGVITKNEIPSFQSIMLRVKYVISHG